MAPSTISIHQRLSTNLKKVSEPIFNDEVLSLQLALNLIFQVSIIEMMQSKNITPENQSII